jgi:hypothetical protein
MSVKFIYAQNEYATIDEAQAAVTRIKGRLDNGDFSATGLSVDTIFRIENDTVTEVSPNEDMTGYV